MIIEDYKKGSHIRFRAEAWEDPQQVKEANDYFRHLIMHDTPREPLENGSLFCPSCMKPVGRTDHVCKNCHQILKKTERV